MGKILVFGGTFDPPHKGHRHLLQAAIREVQFDRVLVIPSYIPPHKEHRPALSYDTRRALLLDWNMVGLEVLDIEQKREEPGYTVDTVKELLALYPGDTLYFLIGSDMFLSFEKWYQFETLLRSLILVVGSRYTGDFPALEAHRLHLLENYDCKGIILCSTKAVECASSTLRATGEGLAERVLWHIGSELDPARARHTVQVADYARELALRHGVDPEKAYLAGLLHDCTKSYGTPWHLDFLREHGVEPTPDDLSCPQVLHQLTAPVFARERLGVTDEGLLSAIGCHTTGKPDMTDLEMLLLFADSCEPTRTFPGVTDLRAAVERDLRSGALQLLTHTIHYILQKNSYLHPLTVAARNSLLKEFKRNG